MSDSDYRNIECTTFLILSPLISKKFDFKVFLTVHEIMQGTAQFTFK